MARELLEFALMILSEDSKEKVLEEFAKFKKTNYVYFPSLQVTSICDDGVIKHFYHLLFQYKPK